MKLQRTKAGVTVRAVRGLFPPVGDEALQCNARRELSLPPAAWRVIDSAADHLDVSRSAFVAFAAAYFIENADDARRLALPL